jgi:hypothetical protein
MSMMNEAAAWEDRVPGDPRYTRALWEVWGGSVAQPPLTTARARWEWRQAQIWGDHDSRFRILLTNLDMLIAEMGPGSLKWTLGNLRSDVAKLVEEGSRAACSRLGI